MVCLPGAPAFDLDRVALDLLSVDIDLRRLGGVNSSQHHTGRDGLARIEARLVGDDDGFELVDPNVLESHVGHERVKHLAFRVAYVALQLGKQRDGGRRRHILKHILLPVFVERRRGHGRGEVAADDLLLQWIVDETEYPLTVAIDSVEELASLSRARAQHDDACGFEVVFVLDVKRIALRSVGLTDDERLQLLGVVEERVAHSPHRGGTLKPHARLGRILAHDLLQLAIDGLVLLRGVARRPVQALLHNGESVEHLGGDVQRKHGHEDDIHEVDHLLAGRYLDFLDSHILRCDNAGGGAVSPGSPLLYAVNYSAAGAVGAAAPGAAARMLTVMASIIRA